MNRVSPSLPPKVSVVNRDRLRDEVPVLGDEHDAESEPGLHLVDGGLEGVGDIRLPISLDGESPRRKGHRLGILEPGGIERGAGPWHRHQGRAQAGQESRTDEPRTQESHIHISRSQYSAEPRLMDLTLVVVWEHFEG